MIVATTGYSLVPLAIALGGGADAPFLLNAGLTLGLCLGYVPFVLAAYPSLLLDRRVRAAVRSRVLSLPVAMMVVNNFEFALFAWSARLVDISVTAILFETWPVLLIVLTMWLYRGDRRYRAADASLWLLLAVGFAGFAFVVLSQQALPGGVASTGWSLAAGIGLAVLASAVTSLSAFGFRWGTDLAEALQRAGVRPPGSHSLELFGAILASLLANVVVVPANIVIGIALGEPMTPFVFAAAVGAGVVCHAGATLCWRNANLLTDNLGVNAIGYATPVLSLAWLFVFAQADVARVDYLVIGATGIIAANLLINFEAEIQLGFKTLLISLWACGSFVCLRDELLAYLPVDWLWPGELHLGALALSATIFTLMLSFRMARLAARAQREDNAFFTLFQRVDVLVRAGVLPDRTREHVLAIDGSHAADELEAAYEGAKTCFATGVDAAAAPDVRDRLAEAEAGLNAVVHSHRHGIEVGELFALIVFSGITVMLGLLGRPAGLAGWPALLFEVFAGCFCAVVVFLMANVWDLHVDRSASLLERRPAGGYRVVLRDHKGRRFEQLTSVVIGLGITAAWSLILWFKWVG